MLVYIPRSFIHTLYIYIYVYVFIYIYIYTHTIGLYLRNLNCNKPIIIKK